MGHCFTCARMYDCVCQCPGVGQGMQMCADGFEGRLKQGPSRLCQDCLVPCTQNVSTVEEDMA